MAQALGQAAIQQGHRVLYREAHVLLEELTDATLDGTRKAVLAELSTVPLLIIDDLGMLGASSAYARRCARTSTRARSPMMSGMKRLRCWKQTAKR